MPLQLRQLSCFLLFCFYGLSLSAQDSSADWKMIKETEQCTVYTRLSALSSIKEVKVVATFDTEVDKFMSVLNNVPAYTDWVYKCGKARRLKTITKNEFIYYVTSDVPFPMKDRDIIIHSKQWFDPEIQGYRTRSVGLPAFIDEEAKYVRVPMLSSNWAIQPTEDDKVKVEYQILTEPGGSLPIWLVNLAITSGPLKTMKGLAKYLAR